MVFPVPANPAKTIYLLWKHESEIKRGSGFFRWQPIQSIISARRPLSYLQNVTDASKSIVPRASSERPSLIFSSWQK